jgi:hypothetical protein
MKLASWKVVGLAGALALGYVVSSANAAQVKIDDNAWADFGLNMKVSYKHLDKRSDNALEGGWSQNVFDVDQARIHFMGQVLPFFQFYAEFDAKGSEDNTKLHEAGINLAFAKEFQVLVGKIRKPFTRAQLTHDYTYLTPQGYWLDPQGQLGAIKAALDSTDGGLMLHGDIADGMLRYRVGVFNENRNIDDKFWIGFYDAGWGYSNSFGKINDKKNFEWNVRIEFTPTMLGFKPESAATIPSKVADTYLGSKDVLTIGLGYHAETHAPKFVIVDSDGNRYNIGDLKRRGWTVDAMFEKKFGNLVPNFQIGYIKLSDTHYYAKYQWDNDLEEWSISNVKKGNANIWYVTGQLLFDQIIGLGKPAIAFRYEKITGDGQWTDGQIRKKDLTAETFGVAFNYYIKGQAARISFGFDQTKYKDALKYALKSSYRKDEDSITDWHLDFQLQF